MDNKFNSTAFGPHLTIDLSGCNKEKLGDLNLIFNLLTELPDKIGMTKITQPYIFPYSGLVPEDKGITGIVIIAESHVSIHSFELKRFCFIDIFSCKPFKNEGDDKIIIEYFKNAFEAEKCETNLMERGKDFPR